MAEQLRWDWREEELPLKSLGYNLLLETQLVKGLLESGTIVLLWPDKQSYSLVVFPWDASFRQRSKIWTGEYPALILYTS
jgi:hypothetical protein